MRRDVCYGLPSVGLPMLYAGLPDSSYTTRHRRPPARGGPTLDGRLVPLVEPSYIVRATPCGLTRGGFLGKFVVKSLERPTERVALGTLLHRLPRPIHPKTSPCKPLAGGLRCRPVTGSQHREPAYGMTSPVGRSQ